MEERREARDDLLSVDSTLELPEGGRVARIESSALIRPWVVRKGSKHRLRDPSGQGRAQQCHGSLTGHAQLSALAKGVGETGEYRPRLGQSPQTKWGKSVTGSPSSSLGVSLHHSYHLPPWNSCFDHSQQIRDVSMVAGGNGQVGIASKESQMHFFKRAQEPNDGEGRPRVGAKEVRSSPNSRLPSPLRSAHVVVDAGVEDRSRACKILEVKTQISSNLMQRRVHLRAKGHRSKDEREAGEGGLNGAEANRNHVGGAGGGGLVGPGKRGRGSGSSDAMLKEAETNLMKVIKRVRQEAGKQCWDQHKGSWAEKPGGGGGGRKEGSLEGRRGRAEKEKETKVEERAAKIRVVECRPPAVYQLNSRNLSLLIRSLEKKAGNSGAGLKGVASNCQSKKRTDVNRSSVQSQKAK